MLKRILKSVGVLLFMTLVIIQFINRPTPMAEPLDPDNDMIELLQVTGELKTILKSNCYDCHSNQPEYPWYSKIAPISWWINGHMDHGREELNFSNWGTLSKRRKNKKLKDMAEEIEGGHMPLPSYTWIHGKLSEEEKQLIEEWVTSERAKLEAEEN